MTSTPSTRYTSRIGIFVGGPVIEFRDDPGEEIIEAVRRKQARRLVITTEQIIGGRRVTVQRPRMPFAVYVGGTT
jgi:hypothetical protein